MNALARHARTTVRQLDDATKNRRLGVAAKLGQTDPSSWAISSWFEDIGPRCAYGWTAAIVFDNFLED